MPRATFIIFETQLPRNDSQEKRFVSRKEQEQETSLPHHLTCAHTGHVTASLFQVLSIDGVPVTHMTRLDCVRRLKESQLVIKLMVRCRGALRPEVVSAEKKSSPEKNKVPPELPSAPPPVPPRKLRQARGLADGEANPSPVKKSWSGSRSQSSSHTISQTSSQNSSQNGSPSTQLANQLDSKSSPFDSCDASPKSNGSVQESPKGSPKERSPEFAKSKQVK